MKQSGFGIAGFVIGIISLLLGCVICGGVIAIIGLILSIIGITQKNRAEGISIAGIVLNCVAIFISLIFFMVILNVSETDVEEQNFSSTIEQEDNIIDCKLDGCTIKYLSHEVKNDRSDKKCIVVYYEFTNYSSNPQQFYLVATDKAFQNGVEIESSMWKVEGFDSNPYVEVKQGVSITIACAYVLREDSEVELEIREAFDFDNEVVDSMTIQIEETKSELSVE